MALYPLEPFAADDTASRFSLLVEVKSTKEEIQLSYGLRGPMERLLIPGKSAKPDRIEGLYKHTCFEAFIADVSGKYLEWNFSPSGDWCVFAFEKYRSASPAIVEGSFTNFKYDLREGALTVRVNLQRNVIGDFLGSQTQLKLGLAAVIENGQKQCSYWALHHSGSKPDFHNLADFTILLP